MGFSYKASWIAVRGRTTQAVADGLMAIAGAWGVDPSKIVDTDVAD